MKRSFVIFVFLLVSFVAFVKDAKAQVASGAQCATTIQKTYLTQEQNGKTCYFPGSCLIAGSVHLSFEGVKRDGSDVASGNLLVTIQSPSGSTNCVAQINNGSASCDIDVVPTSGSKVYSVQARQSTGPGNTCTVFSGDFVIASNCQNDQCKELKEEFSDGWKLCLQIPNDQEKRDRCINCLTDSGVWTAIGCIPTSPQEIIKTIVTIGMSLAGVVVLILILISAFTLSTSQGDPNKTKEAKEMLTSAIVGLLFIIFSVTILQFIGVSILNIPGFGE